VAVVIPYFDRWMRRFPTIRALAEASIEEVIKEWEGLGYYSRERNLHEGARYVVQHYGGELPPSAEELSKIKGLGSYTIGAILSFAFHQRVAAVDGNVLRVLARFFCLEDDISKAKTVKKIRSMAQDLLPESEPWIVSEALIELGATVCMRTPKCGECPLRPACTAYAGGMSEQLPIKSGKTQAVALYRAVAVLSCEDTLLVGRGAKGKVMADLCEFPYFEFSQASIEKEEVVKHAAKAFDLEMAWKQELSPVRHSFTRYRALLVPHLFFVKHPKNVKGFEWLSIEALKSSAFSSGHRRIFSEVQASAHLLRD
jgi:A/G-specific adenine glycosylase